MVPPFALNCQKNNQQKINNIYRILVVDETKAFLILWKLL